MAVEHVLHAIAGIEDAGHHAAAGPLERADEHGLALGSNRARPAARKASSSITPSFSAQVSSAMPSVENEPSSLAR